MMAGCHGVVSVWETLLIIVNLQSTALLQRGAVAEHTDGGQKRQRNRLRRSQLAKLYYVSMLAVILCVHAAAKSKEFQHIQ